MLKLTLHVDAGSGGHPSPRTVIGTHGPGSIYFAFLQPCPPDVRIGIGEGRLSVAIAPGEHYGLIVFEALSSA